MRQGAIAEVCYAVCPSVTLVNHT